jgi:hypothetical protein
MNAQLETISSEVIATPIAGQISLPLDVLALVGGGEGTVTPY